MSDPRPADTRDPEPEGGDPVCWLDRVCPECGRLADESATHCPRCAAALPD